MKRDAIVVLLRAGPRMAVFCSSALQCLPGCILNTSVISRHILSDLWLLVIRQSYFHIHMRCRCLISEFFNLIFFKCLVLITNYYSVDQIKKNEVGGACSTYGKGVRCIQDFGGET
jgi:hypothetical protein